MTNGRLSSQPVPPARFDDEIEADLYEDLTDDELFEIHCDPDDLEDSDSDPSPAASGRPEATDDKAEVLRMAGGALRSIEALLEAKRLDALLREVYDD